MGPAPQADAEGVTWYDAPTPAGRAATAWPLTIVCWVLTVAGSGLVLASAHHAQMYRCWDGWTNEGEQRWFHAVAAVVVAGPAIGRALWLVLFADGSRRLRMAAVLVAVLIPLVTSLLVPGLIPEPPTYGTCGD